ncbi:MAG: hypothetical protein JSS29_17450 [Proteobacteria bacterium]|nr:hypothetical protein [Pseudomonadota bacterium]
MRILITAAALSLALNAAPAFADRDPQSGAPKAPKKRDADSSPITDHFYARISWYGPSLRTNLRADPTNAPAGTTGTSLNGENDLGLPGRLNKGRVEFMFRLRDRNKVRIDYFEADRSGSAVLNNPVVFNNQTFLAGLATQSELDWKQFSITYTYSFIRNSRFEVGSGIGIYFLQADATLTQAQPFAISLHQEVSAATPFPALPLDLTWRISSRWSATARGAYLKATVSGFRGWYADLHEDLQYRWNPNLALGIGYTSTRTSLNRSGGSTPGYFGFSISGPEAFVRLSF